MGTKVTGNLWNTVSNFRIIKSIYVEIQSKQVNMQTLKKLYFTSNDIARSLYVDKYEHG